MDKKEALAAVQSALAQYNNKIKCDDVVVRAFYLKWDYEFENWVATAIFVLDDIQRAENMDFVDEYCSAAGAALDKICAFTYCTFRSEDQYDEEFSSRPWVSELMDVERAA